MQRLARHELKGTFYEVPVSARILPYPDAVTPVSGVGKQRVTQMLHVRPNLVGAAGFQHTANPVSYTHLTLPTIYSV